MEWRTRRTLKRSVITDLPNLLALVGGEFASKLGYRGRRTAGQRIPTGSRHSPCPRRNWAWKSGKLLLGVNVMSEPMGQAFADILALVRDTGYHRHGEAVVPNLSFDLASIADASGADEIEPVYHRETLRALRQRVNALAGTGLFSASGTTIQELLSRGRLSIVMLGRLPQSYRTAVVAVITRMLIDRRSDSAFAEEARPRPRTRSGCKGRA